MATKTFRTRIKICAYLAVFPVIPISGKLFYLQTIKHADLSKTASKAVNKDIFETGPRGRILDSEGNVLVESITAWDCSILKKEVAEPQKMLHQLPPLVNMPPLEFASKYKKTRNYLSVKKNLDRETFEKIEKLKIKGISLEPKYKRYYPSGNIARGLLGIAGEEKGLTGIELLYDRVLGGRVNKREILRDAKGKIIYRNETEEGQPLDVHTTIDKNIQFFAQEMIKKYTDKYMANLGIVIVQAPHTGRILAMSSYPEDPEKTIPVEWVYEPGSTFKIVTLSAALEKGIAAPEDKFFCENGKWQFNGAVAINDHEPEQTLSVSEIIERSSNIGTAKIALKLGLENYYYYTKIFGFGTKTGLGFYGESAGIQKPMKNYRPVDLVTGSYGHGIGATPVQMVNAFSAIANGGNLMEPIVVDEIRNAQGLTVFANEPLALRRVVSEETAALVKNILEKAVLFGTGKQAAIAGYSIAGKTGTSKKRDSSGNYVSKQYVVSFCGFFPAENPLYTILVIMDHPKTPQQYAAETAVPCFREIAKKIITLKGIPPDTEPATARLAHY
ncbi:MAG: penicillin-binding protein 2 [Elusimicrobia bacterium]|nr:penicillin-binding protein 2 [Elusimicrobiota bacterium]